MMTMVLNVYDVYDMFMMTMVLNVFSKTPLYLYVNQ